MGKKEYDKVKAEMLSRDPYAWKGFAIQKQRAEALGVEEHELCGMFHQAIIDGEIDQRQMELARKSYQERYSVQEIWKLSQHPRFRQLFEALSLLPHTVEDPIGD